jgi:hypothetical protein
MNLKVVSGNPPVVEITEPWDGNETQGIVAIEGTATSDEDVTLVEVAYGEVGEEPDFVNNGLDVTGTESWTAEWDTEGSSGDMEIHARAESETGLESDVYTITITIISGDPVIDITYPADGADITAENVVITGTASDDSGVDTVEVRFGGGAWRACTDESGSGSWSNWSYDWNTSDYDGRLEPDSGPDHCRHRQAEPDPRDRDSPDHPLERRRHRPVRRRNGRGRGH